MKRPVPELSPELTIKAVRSSGAGGQHLNKVSTKIEVYFNIPASRLLHADQKQLLMEKLHHMLNEEGTLRVVSQASRSQVKNKEIAIGKLQRLIEKALTPAKKRLKTKAPRSVAEKRIAGKKQRSEIKSLRKKPDREGE
jgi:ribosome-associated protein